MIMAGAGGQDSQDWVTMILRMYQRYCESRNWKVNILEQSFGEPGGPDNRIGTKSAVIEIKGKNAYGFLKGETGIHRLVRISPFSAQALRHTSFAKVELVPEIEDEKEIEIRPEDLKIEFYRASGPGGQNVNKRETAVRITHLLSGLTATCQSERQQERNKEKALRILYGRLYQQKLNQMVEEKKEIRGEVKKSMAEWGRQIRSYVLHPYKLVKDHRTGVETSDVEGVLEGELDEFIKN